MIIFIALLLSAIVGAFGRRFDGGLLSQWLGFSIGTQGGRAVWGIMTAIIALFTNLVFHGTWIWLPSLLIGVGIVLGSILFGYYDALNSGLSVGGRSGPFILSEFIHDNLLMTLHGIGGTLFPALVVWWFGYNFWWLVIAGLLCSPLYVLAFWKPWNVKWLGCINDPTIIANNGIDAPPTGELYWGAAVGIATCLTFLL